MTEDNKDEDGKTFDMYHFFSRKDVWLAAAVILILLVWVLASNIFSGHTT